MAVKKEEEIKDKETVQTQDKEEKVVTPEPSKKDEKKEEKPKKEPKKKESKKKEQPAFVDEILKVFPQYEKLYINSKGGMYDITTPIELVGDAELYDNPYHK